MAPMLGLFDGRLCVAERCGSYSTKFCCWMKTELKTLAINYQNQGCALPPGNGYAFAYNTTLHASAHARRVSDITVAQVVCECSAIFSESNAQMKSVAGFLRSLLPSPNSASEFEMFSH